MRPSIARLKMTHGRAGQVPMPAAFDPASVDAGAAAEQADIDDATADAAAVVAADMESAMADVRDMVSPMVDSDRTSLHLALLDAMSGATTWRT